MLWLRSLDICVHVVYGAHVTSDATLSSTTATQPVALSATTLETIAAVATVPNYDRSALRPSILHIGVGGFHRAHLATYIDELCAGGSTDWSIVGVGLLPNDEAMAAALHAQDCLYTLIARGRGTTQVDVIGSIVDFMFVSTDHAPLITAIAAPDTQIVSMTITEGGYPIDDTTGDFNADKCAAGSAFDVLVRGLDARRQAGGAPITIMSCDNIMGNGQVARAATLGAAQALDPELTAWIESSVSFPNSMVDRITPVTAQSDIEWLSNDIGIIDRWPVVAEPFRQWVIEDDFAGDRLPLEALDVIVTDDIDPYELTKLRLLNAGHSCLAYLAALDGFELVDTAMADPALGQFVEALLHREAKPTLPAAAGIDLDDYIASLTERFSNPAIGDQISRLCFDGSSKFPKFLIPTIRAQINGDQHVALSALALAGWCAYLSQDPDIEISHDPLLDEAREHARRSIDDPAAFLQFTEVFGPELGASDAFTAAFAAALSGLRSHGVQSAIADALQKAAD